MQCCLEEYTNLDSDFKDTTYYKNYFVKSAQEIELAVDVISLVYHFPTQGNHNGYRLLSIVRVCRKTRPYTSNDISK